MLIMQAIYGDISHHMLFSNWRLKSVILLQKPAVMPGLKQQLLKKSATPETKLPVKVIFLVTNLRIK